MIKKEEVEKVAKLARLKLTEEEVLRMQKDLSSILDYFNLLKKAEPRSKATAFTTGGKGHPGVVPIGTTGEVLREDTAKSQSIETIEKLIKEIPEKKERYIKVKTILD